MFLDHGIIHNALKSRLTGGFVVILVMSMILPLLHVAHAQTLSDTESFSVKGTVSDNSNFHGVVMWTIISGDKGTILIQSPAGRGLVHVSITKSTTCESSVPICLFSTVVDTTDNDVFKVGDTARFAIDLDGKQETVSLLTGLLAGFDVSVNLSKMWNMHYDALHMSSNYGVNSTKMETSMAPRHYDLNLTESVGIQVKS